MGLVVVLTDAGNQHRDDAKGDQSEHESREDAAQPPGFQRAVRDVRLRDALNIDLLAAGFAAGIGQRGNCGGKELVGDLRVELIAQAGQLRVVRVLDERVLDEFDEETRLDSVQSSVVDEGTGR